MSEETEIQIIGFGSYQKVVADCLAFNPESYKDLKEGTPVLAELFYSVGDEECNALEKALGFKVFDFNTHLIDRNSIDWEKLEKISDSEDYLIMKKLFLHGFNFMVQHL